MGIQILFVRIREIIVMDKIINTSDLKRCLHVIVNRLISSYSFFKYDKLYSFQSLCKELYVSELLTKKEMKYMLMFFIKINSGDRYCIKVCSVKFIMRCLDNSLLKDSNIQIVRDRINNSKVSSI